MKKVYIYIHICIYTVDWVSRVRSQLFLSLMGWRGNKHPSNSAIREFFPIWNIMTITERVRSSSPTIFATTTTTTYTPYRALYNNHILQIPSIISAGHCYFVKQQHLLQELCVLRVENLLRNRNSRGLFWKSEIVLCVTCLQQQLLLLLFKLMLKLLKQ